MASVPKHFITEAEYLARERAAEHRSEYLNGEIFAMAGTSKEHEIIVVNTTALLWNAFRGGPCAVFGSNLRVRVNATGLYTYPDLSALCGEPEFVDGVLDTLTNPQLIVEVLSKTTASYDRGGKADHYRKIASLREYLLLEQSRPHAELFQRGRGRRWEFEAFDGLDAEIELTSVPAKLSLRDIYDRIVFPEARLKDGV